MISNKRPFLVGPSPNAILLCALSSLFVVGRYETASAIAPLQFNLKVLSSDLEDSDRPVINGDNVIWTGRSGGERKVYRYNVSSGVRTVLNSSLPQPDRPSVDGNYVAWENTPGISLHDLSSGITSEITTAPYTLTTKVSGNNVIWREGRPQDSFGRIMRYNIDTHISDQLSNFAEIGDIEIAGNDVVWSQRMSTVNANSDEIFHYSLQTGITTRLTNNSIPDRYPQVSAGTVVWQTYDTESTAEIFRRNLQTGVTQQLTTNSAADRTPEISGTNVVWQGSTNSGVANVFYRDLVTGITTQLTHATSDPFSNGVPKVSGQSIVWNESTKEVFYYDIATGITSQVTNSSLREEAAIVYGTTVVFRGERPTNTNRWDVVVATPVPEPAFTAMLLGLACGWHLVAPLRTRAR